ncbi:MAG TPA: NADH dehydrogenase (quinone) subunit D [Candidatus Krumholzibacteria bacterium]|nr:NADH dehydrogenase (quinone) subunit D [Candidatus Krumholzibacteria bacterium]
MPNPNPDRVRGHLGEDFLADCSSHGDLVYAVHRRGHRRVLRALRDDPELRFDMLMDLTAADRMHLPQRFERFEVVYELYSLWNGWRLRLKVPVPADDPHLDSIHDVWKAANWAEREAFDMFGIRFDGHPNLKRILCHHEFVGHPLRKDYDRRRGQWCATTETLEDELQLRRAAEHRAHNGQAEPAEALTSERMLVNIGPSHPVSHGTLRVLVELEGETIKHAIPEIGYLHRGFEKSAEKGVWNNVIPYADRLNYVSALSNNVAYVKAVEKLAGVEVPDRCKFIRVILNELSRIMDHCVCNAANIVDVGALTNFWYLFSVRENIYKVLEKLTGARLTNSYTRVGGLARDLYPGFADDVRAVLKESLPYVHDVLTLVKNNRIFQERTVGVSAFSATEALSYGWTGPCLRACGVPLDARKRDGYYFYDQFNFDVPVGEKGDAYDRILVRFEEIFQSVRIIEQALDKLPGGPVDTDRNRFVLPPKQEVYRDIEPLMNHFMLVMFGTPVPPGETYDSFEVPNGELGFYIISDGSGKPYRVRVRPPCFYLYQAYPEIIEGSMVADMAAVLGSLNVVAGELDR